MKKCFLCRNFVKFERKNNTTLVSLLTNCPQVIKDLYDWPVKYYFWWFWYKNTMLYGWVQLWICFIRCGYDVHMCIYFFYCERKSKGKKGKKLFPDRILCVMVPISIELICNVFTKPESTKSIIQELSFNKHLKHLIIKSSLGSVIIWALSSFYNVSRSRFIMFYKWQYWLDSFYNMVFSSQRHTFQPILTFPHLRVLLDKCNT